MTTRERVAEWVFSGTAKFEAAVRDLSDLRAPSALPGWTRAHVVAHVARNADALCNLLDWARTGVETPMYASPEQRDSDIETGARQDDDALVADLFAADARFADRVAGMPGEAWAAEVRTRQGRRIPGAVVLFMRVREVWIHAADLTAGATFDDFPLDLLGDLIDDVAGNRGLSIVRVGEGLWTVGDLRVTGSPASLAAWLTGRSDGRALTAAKPLPELPSWL